MRRRTGPSVRLDIEAEVGFVVGVPSRAGHPGADEGLPPARLRGVPGQRLERPGPAGLGVRAARAVPGEVVRDLGVAVGRAAGRAAGRPGGRAGAGPAGAALPGAHGGLGAGPRAGGGLERHRGVPAAVRRHVLDAGPAARAPHRQRRLAAHRRPLRLRHGVGAGARPARLVPRAVLERRANRSPWTTARRGRSWRTATRSRCRPGPPAPRGPGSASARSPAGWSPPAPDRRTSGCQAVTNGSSSAPTRESTSVSSARRGGRSSSAALPSCWKPSRSASRRDRALVVVDVPLDPLGRELGAGQPDQCAAGSGRDTAPSAAAVSQQPISTTAAEGSWWSSRAPPTRASPAQMPPTTTRPSSRRS